MVLLIDTIINVSYQRQLVCKGSKMKETAETVSVKRFILFLGQPDDSVKTNHSQAGLPE